MVGKNTKLCKECGLELLIKQINQNTAMYLCQDLKCHYNSPKTKWMIIKRTYKEWRASDPEDEDFKLFYSGNRKKRKVTAELADIDQLVDLTYDNTCESAVYTTTEKNYSQDLSNTLQYNIDNLLNNAFLNSDINYENLPAETTTSNELLDYSQFNNEASSSSISKLNSVNVPINANVSNNLLDKGQLMLDFDMFDLLDIEYTKEIKETPQFGPTEADNKSELLPKKGCSKFDGFKFTSCIIQPAHRKK